MMKDLFFRKAAWYWLFLLPEILHSQTATLSGWVSDSLSGERLVGVSVQELSAQQGTATDNYGFFSLHSKVGSKRLRIAYAGYESDTLVLELTTDTILYLNMMPQTLGEVVITAEALAPDQRIGVVNLSVDLLKSRPALLGEADLMKALALTPGIRIGTEGTAGLHVRGGTPDQNYILLDGATVYNTSHLFGFLSVFNPDAVKSISLYKGAMPARYGGRLSSVIDVTMKEGNNQEMHGTASLGLISSHLSLEGPLRKGHSSYLFSARTSYLGALAWVTKPAFEQGRRADYSNYWMYDLNGKVNFELTKNSRLYASFYVGKDDWKALSRSGTERYDFGLNWGNQTASVRYTNLLNSTWFYTSHLTYNRYRYAVEQVFFAENDKENRDQFLNRSYVQDWSWKNSVQCTPWSGHQIEGGIETTLQTLQPQAVSFKGGTILADSVRFAESLRYQGFSGALYAEDRLSLGPRTKLTVGLRGVLFTTGDKKYSYLEPRTSLAYNFDHRTAVQFSWRQNQQFVHLLATSSVGLPNEIWAPATANVPPSTAQQWSLGLTTHALHWQTIFILEGYYKSMKNLLDYRQGINIITSGRNWEELVERGGEGRAYGVEFMAHRTQGRLNGWISYTLAWNERRFQTVNGGMWYPSRFDRRHDFACTGSYRISEKWSAAANFLFATGDAFTAPSYFVVIDNNGIGQLIEPVFLEKNGSRTPNYHRLDISFTKSYINKHSRAAAWTFGVYNAYAHINPFYVDISRGYISNFPDLTNDKFVVRYQVKSLFTFIPSVNYAVKF